jgi:hypothetical protein
MSDEHRSEPMRKKEDLQLITQPLSVDFIERPERLVEQE